MILFPTYPYSAVKSFCLRYLRYLLKPFRFFFRVLGKLEIWSFPEVWSFEV